MVKVLKPGSICVQYVSAEQILLNVSLIMSRNVKLIPDHQAYSEKLDK